jgi:hypothetical protein
MRRRIFGALLFGMASLVAFGQTASPSDPNREAVQTKVDARSDVNAMQQDHVQLNTGVKAGDRAQAAADAKALRQDKRDVRKDKQKIKQDKRQSSQIRANAQARANAQVRTNPQVRANAQMRTNASISGPRGSRR